LENAWKSKIESPQVLQIASKLDEQDSPILIKLKRLLLETS